MIVSDQPTCFSQALLVGVSSRHDGTMRDSTIDIHNPAVVEHRESLCEDVGFRYKDCVYQIIRYGKECSYDIIGEVDRPDTEGVWADVLYTEKAGIGLFLPTADCIGTVLYDPVRRALALAHLGRHGSIAKTMTKTIDFFCEKGSKPSDITVWMAPHVAQSSYRMEYFDEKDDPDWRPYVDSRNGGFYLDMAGFNSALAQAASVKPENIFVSTVDTATDPNYFSHSQGDAQGRFAVFAMMR